MAPKALKAILPVICSHCNGKGVAYPGVLTIAILSGLSTKQASIGIQAMRLFPDIQVVQKWSRYGKKSKMFVVKRTENDGFPIYSSIFHGGNWSQLSPSGKALYPVLRHYGSLPSEELVQHAEDEDPEAEIRDLRELYASRGHEYCNQNKSELSRKAGIHRTGFDGAIESIINAVLADPHEHEEYGYIVRIKPERWFKRDFLNEQTAKRYAGELYRDDI